MQLTEQSIKRMGLPSWWILKLLTRYGTQAPFEIQRRFAEASAEFSLELGAGTIHHALIRMERDRYVESTEQCRDVPVGHGATRDMLVTAWRITPTGRVLLSEYARLEQSLSRIG